MKILTALLTLMFLFGFNINQSVAAEAVLSKGTLTKAFSRSLQGNWKIVRSGDKTYIELGDNFKAQRGPDVKIFLSPLSPTNITNYNATNGSAFIQQVSVFKGKNRIEIPANINVKNYKSLVFHCEAYEKLWGSSSL